QHFDHAGLHAPRLPGAREGLRRRASKGAQEVKVLVLKPGRDKSLRRRHPWIFSGALDRVQGDPERGETVLVKSAEGKSLALAAYSPSSQIRARVWSFDTAVAVDETFFAARVKQALAFRASLP